LRGSKAEQRGQQPWASPENGITGFPGSTWLRQQRRTTQENSGFRGSTFSCDSSFIQIATNIQHRMPLCCDSTYFNLTPFWTLDISTS